MKSQSNNERRPQGFGCISSWVLCYMQGRRNIKFNKMLIEYSLPREMQIKQNIGITGEFTEDVPIEIVRTYYITEDTKLH